jgi:predicted NBD/HSP70 family sugar kinase
MTHAIAAPASLRLAPAADAATLLVSANERRILNMLRQQPGITRAAVTRAMELTAQSISRIVDSLVDRRLVCLGDRVIEGRGQPSTRLHLNRHAVYGVGLSIMTDALSGTVMDIAGNIIASDRLQLSGVSQASILACCRTLYDRLLQAAQIESREVVGVGAGITGYFVGQARQFNPPDPLGALAMTDVDALLAERLGRPVWVDNDGNVAAIGEAIAGVGHQYRTFAYVFFAMGIGGAVVIDGKLFRGVFGNAGELGGILPNAEYDLRPTLELLRVLMAKHGRDHADIYDMIHHFDMAAPGVDEWLALSLPRLESICSSVAAVLDPEAIVLGGRLPKALGELLAKAIRFHSVPRRGVPKPFPAIVVGRVEGDAAAIGAAALPLQARLFA